MGIVCDLKYNINLVSMIPNPVRSGMDMNRGHQDTINCCKIGRMSKQAVTCSEDRTIKIWSLESKKLASSFVTGATAISVDFARSE